MQDVDYIQTFIQTGHENMNDKDKHLLTTKIEKFKKVLKDMCKTTQHETIVGLVCS
jgi:peptide deformylase